MRDLQVELRDAIDQIFRDARSSLNEGKVGEAIALGEKAWEKLPEPKYEWDVTNSYVEALALLYRDSQRFEEGLATMHALMASGLVLPYEDRPRFVLGTLYFEMGDLANARKWLNEANQISKGRCFRDEPEKYRLAIAKK
jgi:tetratricopeptide (TPR) repeat protein